MKRFDFRLRRLLDLRRIREQQAQKSLGEALAEEAKEKEALRRAAEVKGALDQRFHDLERTGNIDPVFFRRFQSYQLDLARDVQQVQERLDEKSEALAEERRKVEAAMRQTKVLEKLEEGSRRAYWRDVNRDDEKWMGEIALDRFRRSRESGRVALVLMAVGATGFGLVLAFVGLLFAMGSLDMHKLNVIVRLLRYGEDQKEAHVLLGKENPYVVLASDYDQLVKEAEAYRKIVSGDVDEKVVITKGVLDHRRELLRRVERTLSTMRDEIVDSKKDVDAERDQLEVDRQSLVDREQSLGAAAQARRDQEKQKAMSDMLQSFKSMDPEDVVKVLTGGRELNQYPSVASQESAIEKVADYLSQMSARQRAGILQTLTPDWSQRVVAHLEGSKI